MQRSKLCEDTGAAIWSRTSGGGRGFRGDDSASASGGFFGFLGFLGFFAGGWLASVAAGAGRFGGIGGIWAKVRRTSGPAACIARYLVVVGGPCARATKNGTLSRSRR